MNRPIIYTRGQVFLCKFYPPDKPLDPIEKFVLCLQEGALPQKTKFFTGLNITTIKEAKIRHRHPTEVYLSAEESKTENGVKILCGQIHTYPQEAIIKPAYTISNGKMEIVDANLLFGIGLKKIEDI